MPLSDVSSYEPRSSELLPWWLLRSLEEKLRREEVVLPSGEMTFEASVMRHGSSLALCLN